MSRKSSPILNQSVEKQGHSLKEQNRDEVIEALLLLGGSDSVRELIQLFHECQWRDTQLKIITALGQLPIQRSLEFLFQLAVSIEDIPLAERSIHSIGQTRQPLGARFLSHFYPIAPEVLKPAIVGALGQVLDRVLVPEFIRELPIARDKEKSALLRNLILTLGELKVHQSLPFLLKLITENRLHSSISISALISIGKISRDSSILKEIEPYFSADLLSSQIFSSVKSQILFRSKWQLEDYLTQIFSGAEIHPAVPLELLEFHNDDVKAGLKLFDAPEHFNALCSVLAKLDFPDISSWYIEILRPNQIADQDLPCFFQSISAQFSNDMVALLESFKERVFKFSNVLILNSWLEACAMALPQADDFFYDLFKSNDFKNSTEDQKISTLNQFTNYGLTMSSNIKRLERFKSVLETLLREEPSLKIQGRVLRTMATLKMSSKVSLDFIKEKISVPEITGSCLKFIENCAQKTALTHLLVFLGDVKSIRELSPEFLKALTSQEKIPELTLAPFISACLKEKAPEEVQVAALNFLTQHAFKKNLPDILSSIKRAESIQLHAIIALKSYDDPNIADAIASFLESTNESIVGRTLDTLTQLPGLRAKRIIIDFLRDHPLDLDICDKVVRCFVPPDVFTSYFSETVAKIILENPKHPQIDGLTQLHEKLSQGRSSAGSPGSPGSPNSNDAELITLDVELKKKILHFSLLDDTIKSVLRSAEVPFCHPKVFGDYVDKSSSILEYCKSVDIYLEKSFGRKVLFPKMEGHLHEFQNTICFLALNDEYVPADQLLQSLRLEKHFTTASLPVHKMVQISKSILSGKILKERFKSLDGLRAWAVILLIFTRSLNYQLNSQGGSVGLKKPLIPLNELTDDQIAVLAKKLISLQDIRNPVAHRETLLQFIPVDEARAEVFEIFNSLERLFNKRSTS